MGKKFNRWLRAAARAGINVGDLNQASAMFTGQAPAPAATPAPVTPPPPKEIKPPTQSRTTQSAAGRSYMGSSKKKKKTKLSDLRIRRSGSGSRRMNSATTGGFSGQGYTPGLNP
jgi:hypothetical protein